MRWAILAILAVLSGCSNRTAAPIVPSALDIGVNKTVFVGTTCQIDDDGTFGIRRSSTLALLELQVSIPPNREIGTISDGLDKPDPERDFVIAQQRQFETQAQFRTRLRQQLGRDGNASNEVVVFVHGFNNSFADTAFRVAQLANDLDLPGSVVTYSWPSRGHPLGYEYDADSALFARDGLQQLLENIQAGGAKRIVLVAHSMGGRLVMETLRQLEIKEASWSHRNVSGVVLISPDVNVDVFRAQTNAFQKLPQPFIIFTSQKDVILRLSAGLRWEEERLGNIKTVEKFDDLPILFVDISAFDDKSSGNHFVAGNSPALLALLKSTEALDEHFLRGDVGTLGGLPGQRRVLRNATQILIAPTDLR